MIPLSQPPRVLKSIPLEFYHMVPGLLLYIPSRLLAPSMACSNLSCLPGTVGFSSFELSFHLFMAQSKQLQWFPLVKSLHFQPLCLFALWSPFVYLMNISNMSSAPAPQSTHHSPSTIRTSPSLRQALPLATVATVSPHLTILSGSQRPNTMF